MTHLKEAFQTSSSRRQGSCALALAPPCSSAAGNPWAWTIISGLRSQWSYLNQGQGQPEGVYLS